ncbi:TIGR04190 family B12-binding domain/radical SAM domain protein [Candidatus Bathyarchaeota archaeon]|nr:MAG: TIGR04190 family B12-binding domain/radical SAM domain protein [Candidatus Bathyarchaeota archaeon]
MVDLVLLHPPSIYDFREKTVVLGPISDVVPSSPIFESYPIGFLSILSFLNKHGYKVKILNLALKMLTNKNFNVQKTIESLDPLAFGIDFHWLAHVHGSLKLAKIIKNIHPNKPILMGGLSASYFHIDLVKNYPEVDYVLRGDTVEEPLLQLLKCIEKGKQPEEVSNLTWRDSNGKIKVNPLNFVPESLDEYLMDYGLVIKAAATDLDPTSYLHYHDWFKYPMTAVLPLKGCIYNCITCGGSNFAYKNICRREKTALKKPETLLEEIRIIEDYVKSPVFILNDIRICGKNYVETLFKGIKREKIDNPLIIELFKPADRNFLKQLIQVSPDASVEISPESHDEKVRQNFGRSYGNQELEKTLEYLNQLDFKRVDVFFMIGLPYQDLTSVLETVRYTEKIIRLYGGNGILHPFIAPLAPFLDPGSLTFENPEFYGYHLLYKTIPEHVKALEKPSWKYFLNYQTNWMTRSEIVESTYKAASLLNEVKLKYGLISEYEAELMTRKLEIAKITTQKVDEILHNFTDEKLKVKLQELESTFEKVYEGFLCSKNELLTWPWKTFFDVRLRIIYALTKNFFKQHLKIF